MKRPDQHPWHTPPHWVDRLIGLLCDSDLQEDILGDLYERYQLSVERLGERKARRRYWREALAYMRPAFFKKTTHNTTPHPVTMVKHYFLTAFRNTVRNKAFSTINVLGLALGMTCFLLIFLWVANEKGIDNFHTNGDQLYTLYHTTESSGNVFGGYSIPHWLAESNGQRQLVLAEELKENFPEVLYATNYATAYELPWGYPCTFQYGDTKYKIRGSSASEDFFKMFSYPLLAGDAESVLSEINNIAISEKMARMFFDQPEDALDKVLRYENFKDLVVKAVFKDTDRKSSLQFDYLISWHTTAMGGILTSDNKWPTYIQLRENVDQTAFAEKLKDYQNNRFQYPDNYRVNLGIHPFGDHYLNSSFENGKPAEGRMEYVKIFSGVAIFILIIACVNFMNLATAKSLKRAREVGVRKVIGSSRSYLIGQFLGESLALSFISLVLSLVLVNLLLPYFNDFSGKQMSLPLTDGSYWLFLIGITIAAGLASGSYPALFLSSLKPVRVLKGLTRFSKSALWFRKGLAVFQFSLSILLLIATLVVSRQTNFVQNKHLGYDKENVIYLRIEGDLTTKYALLKERLLTMPGIAMVDRSSEAPHNMGFEMSSPFKWEGQQEGEVIGFRPTSVGYDFIDMLGLEVVEGRAFSRDFATDSAAFMVNETALRLMGMENPLGKKISAWAKQGHIIGILKDYHISSLHEEIKPLIVDIKEDLSFGLIMIKTHPGQTKAALESLELANAEINPNYPLAYEFLDQEYARLYENEAIISRLSNVFAVLAILISCLGLLGLAMFSAEQRIKEIGIRKVLGASVRSIISLFSKEFVQLVLVSFVIAAPIAWYLMNGWLQSFAYSISLAWWIFAVTGVSALLIALLTVSFQTLRAALRNPVTSLRSE